MSLKETSYSNLISWLKLKLKANYCIIINYMLGNYYYQKIKLFLY